MSNLPNANKLFLFKLPTFWGLFDFRQMDLYLIICFHPIGQGASTAGRCATCTWGRRAPGTASAGAGAKGAGATATHSTRGTTVKCSSRTMWWVRCQVRGQCGEWAVKCSDNVVSGLLSARTMWWVRCQVREQCGECAVMCLNTACRQVRGQCDDAPSCVWTMCAGKCADNVVMRRHVFEHCVPSSARILWYMYTL